MNRLIDFAGGRSIVNDDLQALQNHIDALAALWACAGPFAVSGCGITPNASLYDMAAGRVMLNGKIVEVVAVAGIDIAAGRVLTSLAPLGLASRPYAGLSTSKNGIEQDRAQILPAVAAPAGDSLVLRADGMRTLQDALRDATHHVGEITMSIRAEGSPSHFTLDGDGIGKLRGWKVMRPGNGATLNLRDKLVAGAGGALAVGDTLLTGPDNTTIQATAVTFLEYFGTASAAYIIQN